MSADIGVRPESASPPDATEGAQTARAGSAGQVAGLALAAGLTGGALGWAWSVLSGADMGLWVTARATGMLSYLLLTAVTAMGLALAHPRRSAWSRPSPATRLRVHVGLTVFALVFLVLHIVVLALDPWAEVGWSGALLPFGSEYRPLAVTLGLLSLWAGLISGLTASLASRTGWRIWRPLHRFAALAWILAWLHGVLAGSDAGAWMPKYVVTGVAIVALAAWRYSSSAPRPLTGGSR